MSTPALPRVDAWRARRAGLVLASLPLMAPPLRAAQRDPAAEQAIAKAIEAIEDDPRDGVGYSSRGLADADQRRYEFAIALVTRKQRKFAYNNRCIADKKLREDDLALADCNKAIQIDKNYPSPVFNIGSIHLQRGDYQKAIVFFDQAIAMQKK